MAVTVKSLGIDKLTREERIALVDEIWESIRAEPKPPLSEAKKRELERRIAEDDAFPDDVTPWEAVLANSLARLGRMQRSEEMANEPVRNASEAANEAS